MIAVKRLEPTKSRGKIHAARRPSAEGWYRSICGQPFLVPVNKDIEIPFKTTSKSLRCKRCMELAK